MPEVVLIDSQIFIWGIKGFASKEQEDHITIAKTLIEWIDRHGFKMLMPTPQLAELLSAVPASEHADILKFIDDRFLVVPFDEMASQKCADLIHRCLTQDEIKQYRMDHRVHKNKLKFDCMIISSAITRRAAIVFSEDPDLKKFSCGQISVRSMRSISGLQHSITFSGNDEILDTQADMTADKNA